MDGISATESDHQSNFEENNFSPNIFGEIASGQAQISVFSPDTECFFSNTKSKNLQGTISQGAIRSKRILVSKISFGSTGCCVSNIPIYLQAGNFRL